MGQYFKDITIFRGSTDPPAAYVIKSHLFEIHPTEKYISIFPIYNPKVEI